MASRLYRFDQKQNLQAVSVGSLLFIDRSKKFARLELINPY